RAANAEGGERAEDQTDGRLNEPQPLPEEKPTEDAGHLPWDGRDNDLKGLEGDEKNGCQDPPLPKRLVEEVFIDVQADQELVGRGVCNDEPDAIADNQPRDTAPDSPPISVHKLV